MSEQPHPGLHPDPDSLSAFVEGVLPEHERQQCLAHLAECSLCREVVFLAQEPAPAPAAAEPAPAWRRWFAPFPVLRVAAVACALVLAVSLYVRYTRAVPGHDMAALSRPALPIPAPPSLEVRPEPPVPSAAASDTQARVKRAVRRPGGGTNPEPARATPPTLGPPPAIPAQPGNVPPPAPAAVPAPLPQVAESPAVNTRDDRGPAEALSGIAGTVTDQSQAAISGASVTVRQVAGPLSIDARTDVAGQFKLTGLPAGRYELLITAPGFRETSRQIDVRPRDVTTVNSELAIGSVSQTVEVTAAVPAIQSESSMAGSKPPRRPKTPAGPRKLPSKLPVTITAASGKIMLAVDSAGALFVSRNNGKRWKSVRPVWPGKVTRLVALAEPAQASAAVFRLTTDSDSAWLSRDGRKWYPAAPQP